MRKLQLRREIDRYRGCNPALMAMQSPAAVTYAFDDMRNDVLALNEAVSTLSEALRGLLNALPSATTHPAVAKARAALAAVEKES